MVAALLGAGEVQVFAQGVQQRGAGVQLERMAAAIDVERDAGHHGRAAGAGGGGVYISGAVLRLGGGHGDRRGRSRARLEQVAP
ncbi:hypothetical protein D3C86_1626670 [compost metagenome]